MTKTILLFVALVAMAWPGDAATKRKAPKQRRPHSMSSSASRKAPKSKAPRYKSPKYKAPKSKRVKRSYQQAPTPERYKDIQQAMLSKGYYHGEPNGEWGTDSQEALKQFQADQNLRPDGKLNSLSLIALGLGPKRLTAQSQTPAR